MTEEHIQRRLAAILAADVAGYSRLVREDEEGTLASVKSDIAEAFDPNVTTYNGRIFKTMGDGLLVEFASVVDAMQCAGPRPGRQEEEGDVVWEGDPWLIG